MRKITSALIALAFIAFTAARLEAQLTKTVVSITGSVFDEVTKRPVGLVYKVVDKNGKIVTRGRSNAAQNGYYFVTGLKPGNSYKIIFNGGDNYFDKVYAIEIPNTDKYAEFSKDFLIPPKKKGVKIAQTVPTFERNKSKLRAGASFFLENILETLKRNKNVKFTISCYPDNDKDPSYNKKLTEGRCSALKEFFVKNGIDASRIAIEPHEKTDPQNPPPVKKRAKGKRYIGSAYYVINSF